MKRILKVPLFLGFSLLVGCTTLHDQLLENSSLTTEQRIAYLAEQPKISADDAIDKDNATCISLLECAVYLNDYELAEWILKNAKHPQYYATGYWKYKRHVIYAPLRSNLSDAEASKYLKLFLSYGFNPSVCDDGRMRPIAYAFKKGYIESFKVLLSGSDELLNGESKQQLTHCSDPSPYIDSLFESGISKDERRRLTNDAIYNSTRDSLLSTIIKTYDKSTKHQAEMLFLLLEAMDSPQSIYNYHTRYRCARYSGRSALAYANCKEQYDVVNLLTTYYMSTSKLDIKEKAEIFWLADYQVKNTLSDAELRAKNAQIKRENQEYRRKLKAQFDAAFNDSVPSYDLSSIQSISEQLGTGNLSATTLNSLNNENKGNLVNFDFHLHVDSVGVEAYSEQNKTSFVGETCKRYPWASTCKAEAKKPSFEEGYWDCQGFVKGKRPATQKRKSQPGKACTE